MKIKKLNIHIEKKCVLIAPLDWGLGHATRCIPIIYELLMQGCIVLIAAQGASKILLQQEFPALTFIPLKGYTIKYSKKKYGMPAKIFFQLPRLISRIWYEHRWLKKNILKYSINAVISDNRYGLYNKTIPCIFITHQLKIKTGNSYTEKIIQKINYRFINKYTACWIPDNSGDVNLAGELSHPEFLPRTPVTYIGSLSRFIKHDKQIQYDIAIVLSGPEPQRTIFETLLLKQIENYNGRILFIRGLPGNNAIISIENKKIEIKNYLSSTKLNEVIQESGLVISRSGYTTIMDLIKLQKKSVLIPTPGQTEQEYLANYLMEKKIFYSISQNNFCLANVLEEIKKFPFAFNALNQQGYKTVIQDFVNSIT